MYVRLEGTYVYHIFYYFLLRKLRGIYHIYELFLIDIRYIIPLIKCIINLNVYLINDYTTY